MYKIRTFNKIDPEGLRYLPEDFNVCDDCDDYDGIILRSYKMSEAEITDELCAVARAGAGVNNIPVKLYADKGIVVFNTPGANANAVKELVVLGALLSARKVVEGINWLQSINGSGVDVAKEVEAQKSKYTGPELLGKNVGVLGLGAIGVLVANTFDNMGAKVFGYDPFISVEHAWGLNSCISRITNVEWMFKNCDVITMHIPLMEETKGFVGRDLLTNAKPGIRILNFARGELFDDDAMVDAINAGTVSAYVTDFPNEKLLGIPGIIAIPHLGASTPESETNCAIMAAKEISDYLINGNICNSVNYPDCSMGKLSGKARITLNHKNIPNMVGQITSVLARDNVNISDMINKSKDDFAYTMIDIDSELTDKAIEDLQSIQGVLKVRKLL